MDKHREPQIDEEQIIGNLRTPSPKWDFSIKSLPSNLRELFGKETEQLSESMVIEDTKETKPSRKNTIDACINS